MKPDKDLKKELLTRVRRIQTLEIRKFTEDILSVAPESFWTKRASQHHHPIDERQGQGTLLHTIRTVKLSAFVAEALNLDTIQHDILLSAMCLHDVCKYGLPGTETEFTTPEHPNLVRILALSNNITWKSVV